MLPVTKQDAIWRQLHIAIEIWFDDGDPVSIHTLACSALKVAHDIGKRYGKKAMLYEKLPAHLKDQAIEAQGFFKHAGSDASKVLNFNPVLSEYHIYDGLMLYKALYGGLTVPMTAFAIRFLVRYPNIGKVTFPSSFPVGLDESTLAKMSNREFYAAVMPYLSGE